MAGQPVFQEVSPELEVILVAGLFVPGREDRDTFKGFNLTLQDTFSNQCLFGYNT